ncbi:MAG TPA: formylmethanofuran dehydrogenase subunit B [Pirellulales bacterium]|nr:formylmethanofuran dehydrogenase subunit B [Pirellulales bacterium]
MRDATCAGCSCACDDIELTTRAGRVVSTKNACELGQAWFATAPAGGPSCLVAGRPASVDEGIERAAHLLAGARRPLVYGLTETSCEAMRLAAKIADWIGGVIDTAGGGASGLGGLSLHGVGEVTCSLGEIANRADVLLVWRANPRVTHPRHFSRYSLEPRGRFVPGGRSDRTCIVVDAAPTESAAAADRFVPLRAGSDFEALWILRAIVRGVPLDGARVLADTGTALADWQTLADELKGAKYAVILFDQALGNARAGHVQVDALWALVRDLNAHTRVAAAPLSAGGNAVGAGAVLCWQTGATGAIDLARGYPRYSPEEYTAEAVLTRGEVDAALLVAADRRPLSAAAQNRLARLPRVTIGSASDDSTAEVAFRTALVGRESGGTIFRTDGVPLPLRPALGAAGPTDVEILTRLERRVQELRASADRGKTPARA